MNVSSVFSDFNLDGVIYKPGVYYDVQDDVYHSINAISNSALKEARKSLKHLKYFLEVGSSADSPALEFGYMTHLCILQHELFKERTIMTDFESKSLKGYKDMAKANPDKHVLSKSEGDKLIGMLTALGEDKSCMDLIKDGKPEVTVLAKDPETGLNLKARFDWVSTDPKRPYILDYKTTEDAKPTIIPEPGEFNGYIRSSKFEKNANQYGYENQGAFYMYVAKLAGIKAEYFALIAQEKTAPYVPCSYVYEPETLSEATDENRLTLNKVCDAIRRNVFTGYSDKPVVLARPDYARSGK